MREVVFLQDEPRGPSIIIEVPVTANGRGRVPLPDVAQLRSTTDQRIVIKWVRLVTAEILTNAPLGGQTNAPIAELQKMTLVIYAEGWEKGQNIPVLSLTDTALSGGTFPHRYTQTNFNNWSAVDWPKSYIQYSNGTLSANSPYAVLLEVGYVKLDATGNVIVGPSK
jgi:hypothetical protein